MRRLGVLLACSQKVLGLRVCSCLLPFEFFTYIWQPLLVYAGL